MIVTIDGPAGAGKTTVALALGERTAWPVVLTGHYYRAAALLTAARDADGTFGESISSAFSRRRAVQVSSTHVLLDGVDVTRQCQTADVVRRAVRLAADPQVRHAVTTRIRNDCRNFRSVVVEGRDAGSVIFPKAHVKVYLDADLEVRVARRALEGAAVDLESTREWLVDRDNSDMSRAVSPLVVPDGAHVVDCTMTSIAETIDLVADLIRLGQDGKRG